ncbi:hypothetical protein DFH08DRAFT_825581 [Mycena albidolilacea]|uniref:Uncharacterized protein n=1 Tax=Mycena albidolilacea TaxID=1033008 RepID=A0AAD6Z2H1_9AGAR|nr:hypothetical protein DFH08DRAFT_825581 [Mycena albidolilacea]
MPSPLRNFALLWNSGLRFFLDPRTSPRRRLGWDSQNTDRTPLPLGYGAESFRRPRRLYHERSDGASVILAFGYDGVGGGVLDPKPGPQIDGFLRLWLANFVPRASFRIFLESVLPPQLPPPLLGLLTTYREFLLLRPAPSTESASTPRRPGASPGHGRGPVVHASSGSEVGSSEDDTPATKKRKTSRPHCPEMVKVTDEDEAPTLADDPRNYDLEEGDVSMSSPELSIAADAHNYDSGLEPAPAVVPPKQQALSSRVTLDDPPPSDACFLRFHPRPAAEIASASRVALVEEIMQQSTANTGDEEQLENMLLMMSEVFGQAGRLLGKRRHGEKGKGKGRAP